MSIHDNIFHNYKDHNPFWRARSPSYLNRRNEIFITFRKNTPGLIPKLCWAGSALLFFIGFIELYKARQRRERFQMINYEFNRKSLPFLQAIEDRRYLAAEQRKDWVLDEMFKDNNEEYLYLKRLYVNPSIWVPPFSRVSVYMGGVTRSYKSTSRKILTGIRGSDDYVRNVPGTHF